MLDNPRAILGNLGAIGTIFAKAPTNISFPKFLQTRLKTPGRPKTNLLRDFRCYVGQPWGYDELSLGYVGPTWGYVGPSCGHVGPS